MSRTPDTSPGRPRIRGFTLVELMIVVAIIGVLSALAIYGLRRYMSAAKTSEAKNGVGAIARAAYIIFERERDNAQILQEGTKSSANVFVLCGSSTPVPLTIAQVAGRKYQPSQANGQDFKTGSGTVGWTCLNHFEIANAIYYRYTYQMGSGYVSVALGAPDPGPQGFEAAAQGDLDADGALSTFSRTGFISNQQLVMATQVFIDDEFE